MRSSAAAAEKMTRMLSSLTSRCARSKAWMWMCDRPALVCARRTSRSEEPMRRLLELCSSRMEFRLPPLQNSKCVCMWSISTQDESLCATAFLDTFTAKVSLVLNSVHLQHLTLASPRGMGGSRPLATSIQTPLGISVNPLKSFFFYI